MPDSWVLLSVPEDSNGWGLQSVQSYRCVTVAGKYVCICRNLKSSQRYVHRQIVDGCIQNPGERIDNKMEVAIRGAEAVIAFVEHEVEKVILRQCWCKRICNIS